jgi:mRNA interferase YafQ
MSDYIIQVTKGFQRKYFKLVKKDHDLKNRVKKTWQLMKQDPFYPSLKTHKVRHSLHGELYSSWVTDNVRLIWDFRQSRNKVYILSLDIGDHDQVYK